MNALLPCSRALAGTLARCIIPALVVLLLHAGCGKRDSDVAVAPKDEGAPAQQGIPSDKPEEWVPGDLSIPIGDFLVDLDIWNGLDGACERSANGPCGGQAVLDDDEESVGAVTVANLNDTDGDGTIDRDDNDVTAGVCGRNEVDLMRIHLSRPVPDQGGNVTLRRVAGDIKVWEQSTKQTEVTLDATIATRDLPKTYWVEARAASGALRDIELHLVYMGQTDIVKATAAWATLERANVKRTRAAGDTGDNVLPGDLDGPLRRIVDSTRARKAADGSRYGIGTMGPVENGRDTKTGGRILFEFVTAPPDVERLGVRWDVTRQRKLRIHEMYVGASARGLREAESDNFPCEDRNQNEAPNDDNGALGRNDEDNEPANQHIYSFDTPSDPLNADLRGFLVNRSAFREWVRARIHPNGDFVNRGGVVEGSRASAKEDWHLVNYLVRDDAGNWVPDTANPSATPVLADGNTGNGTVAVELLPDAETEGYTGSYEGATRRWAIFNSSGDYEQVPEAAVGGEWTQVFGTKVRVVIRQGAVPFANGDQIRFSVFRSEAGKRNEVDLGAIDPTTNP